MRSPKYMSPSSLKKFYDNRDEYYLQYLCEKKSERAPQTPAMAVGSAFDAYVKSYLSERLNGKTPEFDRDTIFEMQVEPHARDEARKAGQIVFDAYQKQGALADILMDLEGAVGKPRFETSLEAYVGATALTITNVPFLGKPDIYFITKQGARIIFDWKVNGYYSKYNISPKPGYVRIRTTDSKNGETHPKAMVMKHNGINISITHPLDTVEPEWAAQLAIYAWLLGEEIGAQFITAIDQIACTSDGFMGKAFRIAQHRSLVSPEFQKQTFLRAAQAWEIIQSGHIFDQLDRAASDAQCAMLDQMAMTQRDPALDAFLR